MSPREAPRQRRLRVVTDRVRGQLVHARTTINAHPRETIRALILEALEIVRLEDYPGAPSPSPMRTRHYVRACLGLRIR